MQQVGRAVETALAKRSVVVPLAWLMECVTWLHEEHEVPPDGSFAIGHLTDLVYQQWLHTDLRDLGPSALEQASCGLLPASLLARPCATLSGVYCVQLTAWRDIHQAAYAELRRELGTTNVNSSVTAEQERQKGPALSKWSTVLRGRRMLKLNLTDGVHNVTALEYEPINTLNKETLLPGSKLKLVGPLLCRRGQIFLKSNQVQLLGGQLDEISPSNCHVELLRKLLRELGHDLPDVPSTDSHGVTVESTGQALLTQSWSIAPTSIMPPMLVAPAARESRPCPSPQPNVLNLSTQDLFDSLPDELLEPWEDPDVPDHIIASSNYNSNANRYDCKTPPPPLRIPINCTRSTLGNKLECVESDILETVRLPSPIRYHSPSPVETNYHPLKSRRLSPSLIVDNLLIPSAHGEYCCGTSTPFRSTLKVEPDTCVRENREMLTTGDGRQVFKMWDRSMHTLEHPFTYIEDIYVHVKSDLFQRKKVFAIRGFLQTLLDKLEHNDGTGWKLTARLTDGVSFVECSLAEPLLTRMAGGVSAREAVVMRQLAVSGDVSMRQRLRDTLQNMQKELIGACGIWDIEVDPKDDRPLLLDVRPVTNDIVRAMRDRLAQLLAKRECT